jgi:hypothetical protein
MFRQNMLEEIFTRSCEVGWSMEKTKEITLHSVKLGDNNCFSNMPKQIMLLRSKARVLS